MVRADARDPDRGRQSGARLHERVRVRGRQDDDRARDPASAGPARPAAHVPRLSPRGDPVRVPGAPADLDGAGTQVRVRPHPAAPRSVRVPCGRLADVRSRGEGHARSPAVREPPGGGQRADQGDRGLPAGRSRGHPPDHPHRERRGPAQLPERRLRHEHARLPADPPRQPDRDGPARGDRAAAGRLHPREHVPDGLPQLLRRRPAGPAEPQLHLARQRPHLPVRGRDDEITGPSP